MMVWQTKQALLIVWDTLGKYILFSAVILETTGT